VVQSKSIYYFITPDSINVLLMNWLSAVTAVIRQISKTTTETIQERLLDIYILHQSESVSKFIIINFDLQTYASIIHKIIVI
jgi:guanylate kinase